MISPSASGDIELSGIQETLGNLTVENAVNLTSIGSDSLREIGGNFVLTNLTALSAVKIPSLASVQNMVFQGLPDMQEFGFLPLTLTYLEISNTLLSTLFFVIQAAGTVNITNNPMLNSIKLPFDTVTASMEISSNGASANVSLPNLRQAGSITIKSASAISMPLLRFSDELILEGNYVTDLIVDALSVVTRNMSIDSNPNLNNTSFSNLVSVGSLDIENNANLQSMILPHLNEADSICIGGNLFR